MKARATRLELRFLAALLTAVGILGVLAFCWMNCATPLLYHVRSVEAATVQPGTIKLRIERESVLRLRVTVLPELHCDVQGTDTVTRLPQDTFYTIPGRTEYYKHIDLPDHAFNGQPRATCVLYGTSIAQVAPFLPPLQQSWQTAPFIAQRAMPSGLP